MSLVNSQDSKNLFQTNDLLNFEDNEEFDETLLLDSANLETANFNNKSNQDSLFNTEKNLLDFEHNTFDDQKFQTAGGKNLFEVSDKLNILNTQEENEQFQKQIEEFSNLPSMMSFSSNTYNKVKPNNNSLIQNLIQPKDIIKEVESDKEFTPNKIIEDIFLKKENSNLKVIKQAKNNDIVPTFKDSICDSKVETSNQNFDVYSFKANLTKKITNNQNQGASFLKKPNFQTQQSEKKECERISLDQPINNAQLLQLNQANPNFIEIENNQLKTRQNITNLNQNLNPTNNPNKICQVSEADQNKQQKEPQQFLLNEINFNNTDEYIRYIVNLYHKFDDEFEYKKNKMIKLPNSMLDFNKLLIQTKKQDDEINELLEKNIKAFKYLLTLYGNAIETCNKMETSMEGLYLEIESSIEGYLSQNN